MLENNQPCAARSSQGDPRGAEAAWTGPAAHRAWIYATSIVCVIFGGVASLIKPFFSNQNTYLLHAAIESGLLPNLKYDWLASTTDPAPVFTFLCARILAVLGTTGLPFANAFLGAAFLAGLIACAEAMVPTNPTPALRLTTAIALVSMWFGFPAQLAVTLFEGVGGQYLFRGYLQPSSFGVMLLWALWAFATERVAVGVLLGAFAVWMSPSYFLTYVCVLGAAECFRRARPLGTISAAGAVAVLPILWVCFHHFSPTDPASFAEACRILVEERIPHHANPASFVAWSNIAQFLLVVIAIKCGSGGASRAVLVMTGLAAALSVAAICVDHPQARLAFPWRTFTVIVPLATAIITYRACAVLHRGPVGWVKLSDLLRSRPGNSTGLWPYLSAGRSLVPSFQASLGVQTAAGEAIHANSNDDLGSDRNTPYEHVARRAHLTLLCLAVLCSALVVRAAISGYHRLHQAPPREVLLVKDLRTLGVSLSKRLVIPPQWETIRLNAPAPVFVDWKSHPYRDLEVLEWWRRVQLTRRFYGSDAQRCATLGQILRVDSSIRWILAPEGFKLACPGIRRHRLLSGEAFSIDDAPSLLTVGSRPDHKTPMNIANSSKAVPSVVTDQR